MSRIARAVSVAVLIALSAASAGSAQPPRPKPVSEAAVRACVRDNLVRYSTPDRADLVQYVDIAAACRSALAGEQDTQVAITPLGGNRAAARRAASSRARAGTNSTPSPAGGTVTRSSGNRAPAVRGGATRRVRATRKERARPRRQGASALPTVRSALDRTERGGPIAESLSGFPGWLAAIVGAAGLVALAGVVVEVRRRLR